MKREVILKMTELLPLKVYQFILTLLHSKLYAILAFLSAIGLITVPIFIITTVKNVILVLCSIFQC